MSACLFIGCNEPVMFATNVCNLHGRWDRCESKTCNRIYIKRSMKGFQYNPLHKSLCNICYNSKRMLYCMLCKHSYKKSNRMVFPESMCIHCLIFGGITFYRTSTNMPCDVITHERVYALTGHETYASMCTQLPVRRFLILIPNMYIHYVFLYRLSRKRTPDTFTNQLIALDKHILMQIYDCIAEEERMKNILKKHS